MLKVTSPYDLSLIKEIPMSGKTEIEKALKTAHDLFLNRSEWIPAYEKKSILKKYCVSLVMCRHRLMG